MSFQERIYGFGFVRRAATLLPYQINNTVVILVFCETPSAPKLGQIFISDVSLAVPRARISHQIYNGLGRRPEKYLSKQKIWPTNTKIKHDQVPAFWKCQNPFPRINLENAVIPGRGDVEPSPLFGSGFHILAILSKIMENRHKVFQAKIERRGWFT